MMVLPEGVSVLPPAIVSLETPKHLAATARHMKEQGCHQDYCGMGFWQNIGIHHHLADTKSF
jgi:hypothetical protein